MNSEVTKQWLSCIDCANCAGSEAAQASSSFALGQIGWATYRLKHARKHIDDALQLAALLSVSIDELKEVAHEQIDKAINREKTGAII